MNANKDYCDNMHQNIAPGIRYNGYAILIAHLENERYFNKQMGSEQQHRPFFGSHEAFIRDCREYGLRLEEAAKAFSSGNSGSLEPYLYNPASFVAFGNTDAINIVAVDSIDYMQNLLACSDLPIKQTCTAFCPEIESLTNGLELHHKWAFSEFSELFNGIPSLPQSYNVIHHDFVEKRPLVGVVYFKLAGMAVLGPGLIFQQATYKAIIKRFDEAISKIKEQEADGKIASLICPNDIDSVKILLLDPQGWSDIAVVMLGTNYTVMVSMLLALRSLKLSNLYEIEPLLAEAVKPFAIHSKISNMLLDPESVSLNNKESTIERPLSDMHVFCSTSTTLGISYLAFSKDSKHQYRGKIYTNTHFAVYPGHENSCISNYIRQNPLEDSDSHNGLVSLPDELANLEWFSVGLHDLTREAIQESGELFRKTHEFSNFVNWVKNLMMAVLQAENGSCESRQQRATRCIIQDISTEFLVPSLVYEWEQRYTSIDAAIRDQLNRLRHVLFFVKRGDVKFLNQPNLNLEELRESIRFLRIPKPLSDYLMKLYSDFANYIADPFLYANVLDLWDIFESVYMVLTHDLHSALKKRLEQLNTDSHAYKVEDAEAICWSFLSSDMISQLGNIIELMQSSLVGRTQMVFRDVQRWQKATDIKAALNNLCSASEIPLLVGMGIVRRVMKGDSPVYSSAEGNFLRYRVGGVIKFSFNPRTACRRYNLSRDQHYPLIAMEMSVAHLFRPGFLHACFHEIAHLVWEILFSPFDKDNSVTGKGPAVVKLKQFMLKSTSEDGKEVVLNGRYEEIFSEMLMHYLIFENDFDIYFRAYIAMYYLDPISTGKNSSETYMRLVEILIRGFLASDPFRVMSSSSELERTLYASIPENEYIIPSKIIDEAKKRFVSTIIEARSFFPEADRLLEDSSVSEDLVDKFEKAFKKCYIQVCCIWQIVKTIYDQICNGEYDQGKYWPNDPPEKGKYIIQMKKAYTEGAPVSRILYKHPVEPRASDYSKFVKEKHAHMEALFLVRNMLRIHLRDIFGEDLDSGTKCCYLSRKPETGEPDFKRSKHVNQLIIDRYYNGLFSTNLQRRSDVLKKRIALLKTLWDISTHQRARRFGWALKSLEDHN